MPCLTHTGLLTYLLRFITHIYDRCCFHNINAHLSNLLCTKPKNRLNFSDANRHSTGSRSNSLPAAWHLCCHRLWDLRRYEKPNTQEDIGSTLAVYLLHNRSSCAPSMACTNRSASRSLRFQNPKLLSSLNNPRAILFFGENLYAALLYLGWFLLPTMVALSTTDSGGPKKRKILFLCASLAIVAGAVAIGIFRGSGNVLMPNARNIIIKSGIGLLTLYDTFVLKLNNKVELPTIFWIVITAMSFVGAILLIRFGLASINLIIKKRSEILNGVQLSGIFLMLTAVIYLSPALVGEFRDRYLIPVIPLLLGGAGVFSRPIPRIRLASRNLLAIAILCFSSCFAILGTRDYLAWNRVRWEAIQDLMGKQNVRAEDIDGGFEFNGWHGYETLYKKTEPRPFRLGSNIRYRVTFGTIPGYAVVKEYMFDLWLPPHKARILVVEKVVDKRSRSATTDRSAQIPRQN